MRINHTRLTVTVFSEQARCLRFLSEAGIPSEVIGPASNQLVQMVVL